MNVKDPSQQKRRQRGATSSLLLALFCLMGSFGHSQEKDSSPNNQTPSTAKSRRLTQFEWDPIPGAKSYDIEIKPISKKGEKKEPFRFSVGKTEWMGELKPGEYAMRRRSMDKRGVPGEWSRPELFYVKLYAPQPLAPSPNQQLDTNESETFEVTLQWAYQPEASLYKVHIEDEAKSFSQDFEVKENQIKVKLPVARKFFWSLIGYDKHGEAGEPFGEPISFTAMGKALDLPKIMTPESLFVRNLEWAQVPRAETYDYELMVRGANRKWNKFKSEKGLKKNSLAFLSTWDGGDYKLSVTAQGPLRLPSKTHSVIFSVIKGDRSIEAEKRYNTRQSIERISEWYGLASYFITQIQSSAVNYDRGATPSLAAIGGTGRIGAGYFHPQKPYGFLGIADLSGFTIGQKNYTYPSIELHGIYRRSLGDLGELRLSGGPYYKELPQVLTDSDLVVTEIDQLAAFGVHAGGEYWYSLTSKLGFQANARIYYPLGGKTPNGNPLLPKPSYQVGFLGSLRLNQRATGLMGYAYRNDTFEYKTNNIYAQKAGLTNNRTSVVGHYLNFLLEWDF